MIKGGPEPLGKIAFCEWDFAKSKTLCFAEETVGFGTPKVESGDKIQKSKRRTSDSEEIAEIYGNT